MGVSGAAPLMSTADQALPVLSIGLHAAPPAVTCTWLAWRASGIERAFAPCPKRQTGEAATAPPMGAPDKNYPIIADAPGHYVLER